MRSGVVVLSICLGLAGCSTPGASSPPAELKLENLLQQALADDFTPGREIVVSYVEIPPNMTMDRHWHPGEEFQYYLDGRVEIAIDGQPSIIGLPGEVGHVPYQAMHTAITGSEGARLLVFRVHTEGEPVRILEEGSAADRSDASRDGIRSGPHSRSIGLTTGPRRPGARLGQSAAAWPYHGPP